MAKPRNVAEQIVSIPKSRKDTKARENARANGQSLAEINAKRNDARRVEAMNLRLAGFSYEAIAERLEITEGSVVALIERTLERAVNHSVEQLREVENARLDRAQAAIWTKVLSGDEKAIATFITISQRRARLNGLDAPQQLNLAVSVKNEMEHALGELRQVMMQNVVDAEVVEDDDESDVDPA